MSIQMSAPLEVGIVCRDLPLLRHFYEQALGMRFVSELAVPAGKAVESALSTSGYTVVRLQTSYGERIKLLASSQMPSEQDRPQYLLNRHGVSYLTFIVDDINSAIQGVTSAGAEFMTGPGRVEVRPGVYLAFCRDPEGNVLELVQYADIASYRDDLQQRKD